MYLILRHTQNIKKKHGNQDIACVAQWTGRLPPKEEVTGSSPVMGIAAEIQEQLSVNEELITHAVQRKSTHGPHIEAR